MNDLTRGSIVRHLMKLALPVLAFMIFQALYLFVDLYFVAGIGDVAIAGVSLGANVAFVTAAIAQVLSVGASALISHATGRGDRSGAILIFNQSIMLSLVAAAVALVLGYAFAPYYVASLTADPDTRTAGIQYLVTFLPALVLQFVVSVFGAGLRGTGVVRPTVIVYIITIVMNTILAAVLVKGWPIGYPMGIAGAGLSSSLSVLAGAITLWVYLLRANLYVTLDRRQCAPDWVQWRRIIAIGLPSGGEVALLFVSTAVIFWAIAGFGVAAQAGFGLGVRVLHVLLLPAMAIATAVAPIVGQSLGAGNLLRVRHAFRIAALLGLAVMLALALAAQLCATTLVAVFTRDTAVLAAGISFVQVASFSLIARGVVVVCSGVFQGLGTNVPAVASAAAALLVLTLSAIGVARRPDLGLHTVWYLFVLAWVLQAVMNFFLMRSKLRQLVHDRSAGCAATPVRAAIGR